ncbi:hypothetical protein B0T26DRAFT_742859 [Lasiosphaeria miniovina]|uniref:Uncharacterized protein n=1 Tax=Lasiosphaeria miniovina TaxID=1954250 RepID=A0AA40A582_9PEZI|nr:uncharacterized protein B0T26DRAFT_742859 [Lasiosphaeria miniovina]KAK0709410.1 hypothetical protein B0T26DRAFT_742859 [Lasiosphaeria miniovina]
MDSEERTQVIHERDMKYQNTSHQANLLVKDEEARRVKLRSMLLRDENSSLKGRVAQKTAQIKNLVDQGDDIRSQLESVQQKCRRQEAMVQAQAREINNLKDELSAFGSVSQDSTKLLSEKLALSREVALLKPEIEHLRSQLSHQKDVLAEKLALERQLNALEVELANEKRVAQKAAHKQDRDNQEEEELRKQVRELEKQLAKEKKATQKHAQTQQAISDEAEGELQSLREELATSEKSLAAEKRKVQQLSKNEDNIPTELREELDQLRQNLAETEKALAAEKRAAQQKAKDQASGTLSTPGEVAQLQETAASIEKQLAAEKKDKARLQKQSEQALAEVEAQQEASDEKLEKTKAKLREAQEDLKKCRADLEKAREHSVTIPAVKTTTVPTKKPAVRVPAKKKKRGVDEMSIDDNILLTPSNKDDRLKRPLKKRGFDPSVVGEKSTFSITPFLNKTINISDLSPKAGRDETTRALPFFQFRGQEETTTVVSMAVDNEPAATEPESAATTADPTKKATRTLKEKKPRGRPKAKPLAESSPSKKNLTARNGKATLPESTLGKVTEEAEEASQDEQENRSMESSTSAASVTKTTSIATDKASTETSRPRGGASVETEPRKKKRKVLGSSNRPSVFDEDEGERVVVKAAAAAARGTAVKPAAVTTKRPPKAGLNGVRTVGGAKKTMGIGAKNPFAGAAFSPLKRDRRGVNASFLA